jgi:imidazolonepropionase-like amidohydrolase
MLNTIMQKTFQVLITLAVTRLVSPAQVTFPSNGAPNPVHTIYACTNAVIHVDHETTIGNGILVFQDGKIIAAAEKAAIPAGAIVFDLKGKHIYSSFIDLYSDYGLPEVKRPVPGQPFFPAENFKGAYGWNPAIKADVEAQKIFVHNKEKADELRKNGIGMVLTSNKDGIVRGSGALVFVSNQKENESILNDKAGAFYSLNKGTSPHEYPSALNGSIALLRQTFYDAQWYKQNQNKTEYNISLDAFNKLQPLPAFFEANDKYNAMRAANIGKEFGIKFIVKGGGNEYQRINDIQNTFLKFIIPVNYPEALDVEDPYDAEQVSLTELKHWEMAPINAAEMEKNLITFCFTSADLKDRNQFLPNIRKAILYGLSEKTALKALTVTPANFINAQDKVGALKVGMYADFFISNKNIFEDDAVIYQHWVNGIQHTYNDMNAPDLRGSYLLNAADKNYKVKLSGDAVKPSGSITIDTTKSNLNFSFKNNMATMSFLYDSTKIARLDGNYTESTKSFEGRGQWTNGDWFSFTMKQETAADTSNKNAKPAEKKKKPETGKVFYPFTAYGQPLDDNAGVFKEAWNKFKNRYDAVLIKNATVWTNNGDTILTDYDVYITEGKIVRIAPNIDAPKLAFAKVIDAKGKHLTPGIIDEHSHIALSGGVNEHAQASSAEVRMGDVVNAEDINIYRQLSGGVTAAQLLHGSANPIGGQSQIIKLRWGQNPEDMKYEKAPAFIKFALGENVKHGNGPGSNRFPQTRMGVEQVYFDYFTRARDYKKQWEAASTSKGITEKPRRDIELDAIAEILDGKRYITCHSYVQSEINMLLHVADSMKFKVNTFTHILEGYKVADKMKAHGVSASTFSDWWAYKLEVMEAIPYNAALLTKMGVNTCINSDDAEMGRRLNQEAAKTVKYGGLSESEALKLVTLNPAKALHIDDKVGSIKVGKVADVVLWTDNPLSVYAKVDKTIIDGQIYFDKDEDAKLRETIKTERARIINKLITEKHKGGKVVKPTGKKQGLYHCDTMEEE